MIENEIRRVALAINELRADWPVASLTTFIRRSPKLANRSLRDVAVAFTWVATDRNAAGEWASATPARVLEAGPWWQAAAVSDAGGHETLSGGSKDEQCTRCNKRWCICRPEPAVEPMPVEDARKMAREAAARRGA